MDYSYLKSGTDIRGNALFTKQEGINLTPTAINDICCGFIYWLKNKTNKDNLSLAIGHDSMLTSLDINLIIKQALKECNVSYIDLGLCSTPSVFMMTQFKETLCDAGIMITASHHPYYKNGLKFFIKEGGISSNELSEILKIASQKKKAIFPKTLEFKEQDYFNLYIDFLKERFCHSLSSNLPLKGMKIAVDAGNGAGGFFAYRVLEPLGADIQGSQYLTPDGNFPNHAPNPENKEAMDSIKDSVLKNQCDLGIIFDTDVDRAAIVSKDGNEINRNKLIALASVMVLKKYPNSCIVTDSITSDGLTEFINQLGGKHLRYKRGYKNVIDKAKELNTKGEIAPLAIETSGHAALMDNYFLDDGAFLMVELIIMATKLKQQGKSLNDMISGLRLPKEEAEIRVNLTSTNWKDLTENIILDLKSFCSNNFELAKENYEGIRVNIQKYKGWFLARMSVHDPVIPINIESDMKNGVIAIAKILYDFLNDYKDIDLSNFVKFMTEV